MDGLVGVLVAATVLALAATVLLFLASEPADEGARTSPGPSATTPSPGAPPTEPPSDLGDDETWLGDLVLDAGTVVTPDSRLRDVHAVGRDTRAGPSGLVAGSLAVDATVPFDVVAEQVGEGVTVRAAGRSQATVLRTVEVAGRRLPVEATGTVEVVDGRLVLEPRSIDVGGPDVLSRATAGVVRRLSTIEHTVEGLPDGLGLQDVTVREDGFRATLRGTDVRLDS